MEHLTFAINVTLDGCIDHRVEIADDETHEYFTGLMDEMEQCCGVGLPTK